MAQKKVSGKKAQGKLNRFDAEKLESLEVLGKTDKERILPAYDCAEIEKKINNLQVTAYDAGAILASSFLAEADPKVKKQLQKDLAKNALLAYEKLEGCISDIFTYASSADKDQVDESNGADTQKNPARNLKPFYDAAIVEIQRIRSDIGAGKITSNTVRKIPSILDFVKTYRDNLDAAHCSDENKEILTEHLWLASTMAMLTFANSSRIVVSIEDITFCANNIKRDDPKIFIPGFESERKPFVSTGYPAGTRYATITKNDFL